jgi:hypothetical protein
MLHSHGAPEPIAHELPKHSQMFRKADWMAKILHALHYQQLAWGLTPDLPENDACATGLTEFKTSWRYYNTYGIPPPRGAGKIFEAP